MNRNEKILTKKAIKGDIAAFEELIKIHRNGLFSYALTMTYGDYSAANDILQEALLKAFIYIKKFKAKSSFKTWLWRIVRNEFINFKTSKKTSQSYSLEDLPKAEPSHNITGEDEILEQEKNRNLRKLISMLSENHQEIISLIDLQELSYEEAADVLGVSISSVKSMLYRAREKLFKIAAENEKLFL